MFCDIISGIYATGIERNFICSAQLAALKHYNWKNLNLCEEKATPLFWIFNRSPVFTGISLPGSNAKTLQWGLCIIEKLFRFRIWISMQDEHFQFSEYHNWNSTQTHWNKPNIWDLTTCADRLCVRPDTIRSKWEVNMSDHLRIGLQYSRHFLSNSARSCSQTENMIFFQTNSSL